MPRSRPVQAQPAVDRRSLLKMLGVAGLASGLGVQAHPAHATASAVVPGSSPVHVENLEFSVVERSRPFDLLPADFVQLQDGFVTSRSAENYDALAPAPESHAGRIVFGDGRLQLDGENYFALMRSRTRQRAPYATVMIGVDSFAGSRGTHDTVFAGLVKDSRDYVVGWYNRATGVAGLDVASRGTVSTVATVETRIGAPCTVAFCLTGTTAALLVNEDGSFRPVLRQDIGRHLDVRQPRVLADYHNAFGARASSGRIVLASVSAGYYGEVGVRDPHVVTYADGTPYIKDNKLYLTLTQAGMGFFETAHWGVWTLDLDDYSLHQVANLFFRRGEGDAVLGDHAGHIVLDEANRRWILAMSTWGDFAFEGVEINYVTVPMDTDVLSGVHVLRTAPLPLPLTDLPTAAAGQWDPHLARINGRWYVAFVNAREFFDFYPALSRSVLGGEFTETALVGADSGKNETEGTVMQRVGGEWHVLASNGDASPQQMRDQYPRYDLSMSQTGTLDAPHPTNIPWPMVVPVPQPRATTRWVMVTFDGTQYHLETLGYGTHGDVVIMEAGEETPGYEFPPR